MPKKMRTVPKALHVRVNLDTRKKCAVRNTYSVTRLDSFCQCTARARSQRGTHLLNTDVSLSISSRVGMIETRNAVRAQPCSCESITFWHPAAAPSDVGVVAQGPGGLEGLCVVGGKLGHRSFDELPRLSGSVENRVTVLQFDEVL